MGSSVREIGVIEDDFPGFDDLATLEVQKLVTISVQEIRQKKCLTTLWVKLGLVRLGYFVPYKAIKRMKIGGGDIAVLENGVW